jgi:putative peptidoglycan lipid II flippase
MSKALFKSTSVVSAMTFTSRMIGFGRDVIAAQIFGATAAVDAFYIAFKIPNFMRNLFAEGSFSQAFVPVLAEYRQKSSFDEVKGFVNHIAGSLGLVLLIITILGLLFAPLLVRVAAPGLDPYRFELATYMVRVTFPYLMLISLTAFAGAVLNTYGMFSVPAFTPSLLNICLIATALVLADRFKVPVEAQAWGVLLAGIVQFLFQLPFLRRIGFSLRPKLNWSDPGVQRVLKLMLPAMFGASIWQISLLLNTIFASFLRVGSVTWLYYSERLAYFPLGVFGVALATVVLPHLSRQHADKSTGGFAGTIDWGMRCNLVIGIPAAVTMLVLAGPLVVSLFQYGKFSAFDVLMTRRAVIAYSLGLPSFMLVKILATAFYARQDVRTPVKVGIAVVIANVILNAVLIFPLAHAGLALASSLGSWFNTIVFIWILHKRSIYRIQKGWGLFLLQLIFANAVLAVFLWWFAGNIDTWMHWHWYQRFFHIFILGMSAIVIYLGCLYATGIRLKNFLAKSI